jgi:hypothetical protein
VTVMEKAPPEVPRVICEVRAKGRRASASAGDVFGGVWTKERSGKVPSAARMGGQRGAASVETCGLRTRHERHDLVLHPPAVPHTRVKGGCFVEY